MNSPLMILWGVTILLLGAVVVYFILKYKREKPLRILNAFSTEKFTTESDLCWYVACDVLGEAGYEDCVIYKLDHGKAVCVQVAAFGPKSPEGRVIKHPITIPFGRGIVGAVAANGKKIVIDDTRKDPRYIPDDDVRYSEMSAPVVLNGKIELIIDTESRSLAFYNNDRQDFILQTALITAMHLQKLRK